MSDVVEGPETVDRVASIQQLWSEGDYSRIGELFAPISERIVAELDDRLGLAGRTVLDAATGTGNTALALARTGAEVRAFDLTPRLLATARARAEAAALDVELIEGDLLAIPYHDRSFDLVVSTFGAFTADDHRRCMTELVRVTRPGGTIVTTAWADEGFLATLGTTVLDQHPELADPSGPDPRDWAREGPLQQMLDGLPATVELERRAQSFRFVGTPAAFDLLEEASGPVQRLRAGVEAAGVEWERVRAAVLERWDEQAEPVDGGVSLESVYGIARISVTA